VDALTRRGFLCGSAAIAALSITPAVAATGVKTLANGKTEIDLKANSALNTVGGVVELDLKKYGKIAVVRTSKSSTGFSVFKLACPHAGVIVKQDGSGGWVCKPPGHGSEFALNGALKVGPASSALKPIKFTVKSQSLIIS
jgi:Rieske Fe-S protein